MSQDSPLDFRRSPSGRIEEPHFRDYLEPLMRRRRTVIVSFIAVMVVVTGFSLLTQPVYRAETILHIEPDAPRILAFEDILPVDATTDAFYQTQYRLIESRSLAQRVIQQEGLLEEGALESSAQRGYVSKTVGFLAAVPKRFVALARSFVGTEPPVVLPGDDTGDLGPELNAAIDAFLSRLQVDPIRNTRLATVSWRSTNPALARRVTNAVAQAYIDISLEAKFETTEQASQFLGQEIGRLRSEIDTAEAELQRFGRERDIISLDERQDTVTQALADLSAQHTRAQTERIQRQTYYEQLAASEPSSISEVLSNPLVQRLKADLAGLQSRYSEMSRTFTEDWPEMQRLRGQITELEERIGTEEERIFNGLVRSAEAAYQGAQDQEQRIDSLLTQQRADTMQLNRDLSTYRALRLEIDSNKTLLESLIERQSETGVSARLQGMRTSNIRVVDPAVTPASAYSPSVTMNLLLGATLGLSLGIGLAWFQEYMDSTLKSQEDVVARVGLPSLGLVPSLASFTNGAGRNGFAYSAYGHEGYSQGLAEGTKPETVSYEHPRSALAEAYRNLRTSVLLSSAGSPPRVVLVTSSVPGEGKTTTALNLAVSMAQVGKKVLLIDADLRKPRLEAILELSPDQGLVHFLTGANESLKSLVQKTQIENLWALPSGPQPPNPAELLASDRTKSMLNNLRGVFDIIVLDSPPVLAVVDALVLVGWTDGVVLVVKGGETPFQVVQKARRRIEEVQGKILGIALNEVQGEHLTSYPYRARSSSPMSRIA